MILNSTLGDADVPKLTGGRVWLRRHFMQERPDGLFLVLEEALVEHLAGVSSMSNTHWEGLRFVDQRFVRFNGQAQPSAHVAQ